MTLEHHVTSLELSKRLKELGVPQIAISAHWHASNLKFGGQDGDCVGKEWSYSAFLASELAEMLPAGWAAGKTFFDGNKQWCAHWYRVDAAGRPDLTDLDDDAHRPGFHKPVYAASEPDARAKLLIHLIENKIIDPSTL